MQRFPRKTMGYVVRDSSSAYRYSSYGVFLDFIKGLEKIGFNISYDIGVGKPITYRKDGKRTEYYDTFVYAHIKRGHTTVDLVTFYTVRKYTEKSMSIVRPNSKNGRYYKDMRKTYSAYRRM